jgi:hypothetical protein
LLEIIVLKVKPNRNEVAISVIVNVVRFIVFKIDFFILSVTFEVCLTLTANACIAATKIIYCGNEPKLACFTKLFCSEVILVYHG